MEKKEERIEFCCNWMGRGWFHLILATQINLALQWNNNKAWDCVDTGCLNSNFWKKNNFALTIIQTLEFYDTLVIEL
jgi:hypothetical protein